MQSTKGSLQRNLNEFLRQYRKAPHSTTGLPPAQLFLGHNLRTRLDLVRADTTQTKITEKQAEFVHEYRTLQPKQSV